MKDTFQYFGAAGSAAVLAPRTELCRREDVEGLYGQVAIQTISKRRPAAEKPSIKGQQGKSGLSDK
jgi:hypothetical protein